MGVGRRAGKKGRVSFGSLDPLIYTGSSEPFRLPDLDLAIRDGRARVESEHGPVGIKLEGAGKLRDGFSGIVAAVAPQAKLGGCAATGATVYGKLTVADEKPRFAGPLRLASLACRAQALRLGAVALQLDATFDKALDGAEGRGVLAAQGLVQGATSLASASGNARFTWRKRALTAHYDLAGKGLAAQQVRMASLAVSGALRTQQGFARLELDGDVSASGVQPGQGIDAALAGFERQAAGSLAAPLAAQLRNALQREAAGSSLAANFLLRSGDGRLNLVAPQAALRGGSGAVLLSLSRLHYSQEPGGAPRLAANFTSGGRGLPQIAGRMDRGATGGLVMQLAMADYAAGDARLAVPRLTLVQAESGALGFSGLVKASGPLPGGAARNLAVPLQGNWSPRGGLAVGRACTPLRFDSLTYANLTLAGREVTLCPQRGQAILRADAGGLRIAAGAPALALAGLLGETPIRIASGPIGFAVPGVLAARSIEVALGPAASASRFRVANLAARIGGDIAGTFAGSEVYLDAVPLDLLDAAGDWRFAAGRLSVTNASFRVEDRETDDRFQPMLARGATLALADNRIVADAIIREPESDRAVVRTALAHNLANGSGHADLAMDGILLDRQLQPEQISRLALGVLANAEGTVRGTGRIDWTPQTVTSNGRFTTDRFDFAAAFGPVEGLSGTIEFTDLLGLVTAPDQRVKIASINPGIEVNDGELRFALKSDSVLEIDGANWPFLDGRLTLRADADDLRRGRDPPLYAAHRSARRSKTRRAAGDGQHQRQRHLRWPAAAGVRRERRPHRWRPAGLAATGRQCLLCRRADLQGPFDHGQLRLRCPALDRLPRDAHRHERAARRRDRHPGQLRRHPPGHRRTAQLHHPPDRQIADPFNVNLRAPFFKLVSSFKSLYDPAYVIDPRTLGLVGADGKPLRPPPVQAPVQPPVSGSAAMNASELTRSLAACDKPPHGQ